MATSTSTSPLSANIILVIYCPNLLEDLKKISAIKFPINMPLKIKDCMFTPGHNRSSLLISHQIFLIVMSVSHKVINKPLIYVYEIYILLKILESRIFILQVLAKIAAQST